MPNSKSPSLEIDRYSILKCPFCGGSELHQNETEIFERSREDSKSGLHIAIEGVDTSYGLDKNGKEIPKRKFPTYNINRSMIGNPSNRRQGISIRFWCEDCSNTPCLNISQAKGATFIEWGN